MWYFLTAMSAVVRPITIVLLAVTSLACGYHLVGTVSNLPEGIERLYVEKFQNLTRWSDMDQRIVEAVSLEWVRRRKFELVDDPLGAHVTLSGIIVSLRVTPVSFDEQGRAVEYQMTLTTSVKLQDVRGDDPVLLWEDRAFSRRTSYAVDPSAVDFFDRQTEAMDDLSEEYARAMVSAVLEGF
jgi:outer membrane lipopolysaccharide assembly protein LptE/RlpB